MCPENAHHIPRLESLATVAASLKPRQGKAPVTSQALAGILGSPGLSSGLLPDFDDPYENLFTTEVMFQGKTYLIFPGFSSEAHYLLQRVIDGAFHDPERRLPDAFRAEAMSLMQAALGLSDAVARRAGFGRYATADPDPDRPPFVPPDERLEVLSKAVCFDRESLEALHPDVETALRPLCLRQGGANLLRYTLVDGPLFTRPIVQTPDGWVVTLPHELPHALLHALLALAQKHKVASSLTEALHEMVWLDVTLSLGLMGNMPEEAPPPELSFGLASAGWFSLDTDKKLLVVLLTQPVATVREGRSRAEWKPSYGDALVRFIQDASASTADTVLPLVLTQSLDCSFAIPLGGRQRRAAVPEALAMSPEQLWTLAHLGEPTPLALLKFHRLRSEWRKRGRFVLENALDQYAHFREEGHQLGLLSPHSAEPYPVVIRPGTGRQLREQVAKSVDPHWVMWFTQQALIRVRRKFAESDTPIYTPLIPVGDGHSLMVSGLSLPVWVAVHPSFQGLGFITPEDMAMTTAFWVWQLTPALSPLLTKLGERFPHVTVLLHYDQEVEPDAVVGYTWDAESPYVHLLIAQGLLEVTANGADNQAERILAAIIYRAMYQLAYPETNVPDGVGLEGEFARLAPPGPKRWLFTLSPAMATDLDPADLEDARMVQDWDKELLQEEVGRDIGEMPPADYKVVQVIGMPDSKAVVDRAGDSLYTLIQERVAALSPQGLLEFLVVQYDAVRYRDKHAQYSLAARAASETADVALKHLHEELPRLAETAVAARFLIEYVTACPPSGLVPISLALYDELLAASGLHLNWRLHSEIAHFKLGELSAIILPSGRMDSVVSEYPVAMRVYQSKLRSTALEHSATLMDQYRPKPEAASVEKKDADFVSMDVLDAGFAEEFGFSLSQMLHVINIALNIGDDSPNRVSCHERDELIETLSAGADLPPSIVERVLERLTLGPLPEYMLYDERPWLHGRDRAHARRPFLQRVSPDGTGQILWGNRALHSAKEFWFYNLVLAGRVQGDTKAMKDAMSAVVRAKGRRFNNEVAELVRTLAGYKIKVNVNKIPGQPFVADGDNLGDIDVLAFSASQRRIVLIECKDYWAARTPREINWEIVEMLDSAAGKDGGRRKRSVVEKHRRRRDFVQTHLDKFLHWLDLEKDVGWQVEAVVVVNLAMVSPHLRGSVAGVPILMFEELNDYLWGHPEST